MVKHALFGSALLASAVAASGDALKSLLCPLGSAKNSVVIDKSAGWPAQTYHSTSLTPPMFQINSTGAKLAPGYYFLGGYIVPHHKIPNFGGLIMDQHGELVYDGGKFAHGFNFKTQSYKGKPVLSFWTGQSSGPVNQGHGYGKVTLLNDKYEKIAVVCPKVKLQTAGVDYTCPLDLHESYITAQGTLMATAYNVRQADLRGLDNGPEVGYVFSGVALEVDIATNKVIFAWDSLNHVPVTDTHIERAGKGVNASVPVDYFHINSIQKVGEDYLINSRQCWTSYLVNKKGKILWKFNGATGGDFGPLSQDAVFKWAHFVRMYNVTSTSATYTVFNNDNAVEGVPVLPSSGLRFTLPMPPGRAPAILDSKILHNPPEYVYAEGAYTIDLGPKAHQVLGYGPIPVVAEYNKKGKQLWTARFGLDTITNSYRAYKFPWVATPVTKPDLAIKADGHGKCFTAYASWNGATDITSWQVISGTKTKIMQQGTVNKKGFETSFKVVGPCVQVSALRGTTLVRSSKVVCAK